MPVTTITPISIAEAGVAYTLAAATATDGEKFLNANDRGKIFIAVANGGGAPITVTIPAQVTTASKREFGALTKANAGGSVANATTKLFGPFDACYEDASGYVTVTCSAVTTVTIAAFKLPSLVLTN